MLSLFAVFLFACEQQSQKVTPPEDKTPMRQEGTEDPLPSWNEGAVKTAIIEFVTSAVTEGNPGFIAVEDRIATFDNDGNLWAEQPAYFQLLFAIDRIKDMAADHPEWKGQQPYQAVIDGDMQTLMASGMQGIETLVMTTHANSSPEEFQDEVRQWMATAKHPRTGKPYNQMIYQPMLELLDYLRDQQFKTFIVSGGGVEFMRAWVEEAYGIPPYQVVGSSIKTTYEYREGKAGIRRLPELEFVDDKEGKPVGINRFIGKRPVFASGNSDGDLQMLLYSDAADPGFQLYLHHTDSVREWAYDRDSHIGQLNVGLDSARSRGWTVIDMKKDWKHVFPFEKTP